MVEELGGKLESSVSLRRARRVRNHRRPDAVSAAVMSLGVNDGGGARLHTRFADSEEMDQAAKKQVGYRPEVNGETLLHVPR
jgi:hypothetical protein